MYKNLIVALKELGCKNGDLLKIGLPYNNLKAISIRLNGKTKFTEDDQKDIFQFLKKKGFSGSMDYLFEPSLPIRKKKPESRLSKIIKDRMDAKGIKNADVKKYFDDLDIYISENTISGWRNGRVRSIGSEYLFPLCELLNISPRYLSGFDSFKSVAYDEETASITDYMFSLFEQLYNDALELVIYDDPRYKKIEKVLRDKNDIRFRNSMIQEIEEELYPLIKEWFDNSFGFNHFENLPETKYWIEHYKQPYRHDESGPTDTTTKYVLIDGTRYTVELAKKHNLDLSKAVEYYEYNNEIIEKKGDK